MFLATLHSQEVKDVASKICQQPIVVDLKVRKCTCSEQFLSGGHAAHSSHRLVQSRLLRVGSMSLFALSVYTLKMQLGAYNTNAC